LQTAPEVGVRQCKAVCSDNLCCELIRCDTHLNFEPVGAPRGG